MDRCRFAPSTTGPAHPGTLLAALLCWLDGRARGARLLLRLEDLDPERCRPEWAVRMQEDLAWLGLDWDEVALQSELGERHAEALDALEAGGLLYPCRCSRGRIRADGTRAPDGGWRYPNHCRGRRLPDGGWRASPEPLRVRLPEGRIEPRDEGGCDLAQDPAAELGDPVVRRRDGAMAYQLAVVVDDAAEGITRVVRGRDLAASTATQVRLQQLLDLPTPAYRHHLLLLEEQGRGAERKLAKLHGSVGTPELRARYAAPALCGILAHACGLRSDPSPVTPAELLGGFGWERVSARDRLLVWEDGVLRRVDGAAD